MSDAPPLEARIAAVRGRIAVAERGAGRAPGTVTLVAVSKRHPAAAVAGAAAAGILDVAENYVQEAAAKRREVDRLLAADPEAAARPPLRWSFVGRLQRNKARDAVRLFDCIESVDRIELARELDKRAAAAQRRLPLLLQVSLRGEAQKGGAPPEALAPLLAACADLAHVEVRGLMTVPPADPDPEASRPVFAELRHWRDTLQRRPGGERLHELSMGMTADFEVAIAEGATRVRVGTAIFGPRED